MNSNEESDFAAVHLMLLQGRSSVI